MLDVNRYTLETSREKFYAGGDLVTGASNISNAMGYGKEAARHIDTRLSGQRGSTTSCRNSPTTRSRRTPIPRRRHHGRDLPAAARRRTFAEAMRRPVARGSGAAKPPAACAATSAKPAATSPSINKETGRARCKSPCELTANCAPPPRGRPSSRSPRPTASSFPRSASWKASALPAPAAVPGRGVGGRSPAARLHDAGAARHGGHHRPRTA